MLKQFLREYLASKYECQGVILVVVHPNVAGRDPGIRAISLELASSLTSHGALSGLDALNSDHRRGRCHVLLLDAEVLDRLNVRCFCQLFDFILRESLSRLNIILKVGI